MATSLSGCLGDLAVVAGAVLRRALRRADGLGALQAVPLGAALRVGQRVGASVHHDGVHAVGHREGLEVRLDGDGQRQLVDEVHRRARHDGPAAEVLQAEHCREGARLEALGTHFTYARERRATASWFKHMKGDRKWALSDATMGQEDPTLTSVGLPELLHAVPHEDDARQLREGLDDVEVAERADLEEGHAVLLGVGPGLLRGNLPLEGQVEAVPDQDTRHARSMLGNKKEGKQEDGVSVFLTALILSAPISTQNTS